MLFVETWFAWISAAPTCLFVSIFIISVLRNLCATKESDRSRYVRSDSITTKKGNTIFAWCGIICLISFWIRITIQAIVFTVLIIEDRHQEHINAALGVGWLFYGSGLWLMMLSFVFRIQYTFKGTHLEYSPVIIKILYALLALGFAEVIAIGIITAFIPSAYEIGLILAYLALVSHFTFSCLLTYLLFTKIFNIMQHRLTEKMGGGVAMVGSDDEIGGVATATDAVGHVAAGGQQEMMAVNRSEEEADNTENVEPTMNQISLTSIETVTRYALLMFVGIVSTYIVSVLIFIDIEYGWSVSPTILTWGAALVGFDLLVNAVAVYLLFEYNSSKYYKVCKVCHKGCERICIEAIYCYSKRSKRHGINAPQGKDKQEFATLILAADDDGAVL